LLFGLARLLRDLLACHMGGAHMLIRLDQRHAATTINPAAAAISAGTRKVSAEKAGLGMAALCLKADARVLHQRAGKSQSPVPACSSRGQAGG
jgi:hypothetical protein